MDHLILINNILEINKSLHEIIRIFHHFQTGFPLSGFWFLVLVHIDGVVPVTSHQVHHRPKDGVKSQRRRSEGLYLLEILLLNCVQGSQSLFHQRTGSVQICLCGGLFLLDVALNLGAILLFDRGFGVLYLDNGLFSSYYVGKGISLGLLHFGLFSFNLDIHFNDGHLFGSLLQFDEPILISLLILL